MSEQVFFDGLIIAWFILAAAIFVLLFFVTAPYGRHIRPGWGPSLSSRMGWFIMEAPSALLFAGMFAAGSYRTGPVSWVFLALWEAHYVHRAFIYPLELRDGRKRMPVSVAGMGFFFNLVNAYLNGRWLFDLSGGYPASWLLDPRFVVGVVLFAAGFIINRDADLILHRLRAPGEAGYKIPHGGLYRWVSCPNYLGEILEWCGWALATWSLAGLVFAVWTAANLAPRAAANHNWYRATFEDYPAERRALLPALW